MAPFDSAAADASVGVWLAIEGYRRRIWSTGKLSSLPSHAENHSTPRPQSAVRFRRPFPSPNGTEACMKDEADPSSWTEDRGGRKGGSRGLKIDLYPC